jgi:DNA-binding GntR family transcriptional regulator
LELAAVSYPRLRAAVEARAVLEVGATWLRLSRGPVPNSTSAALYQRLQAMLAQIGDGGRFVNLDAFLAANEAYHAAVIGLAENEHLSQGFGRLRLRELYATALKDSPGTPENVVTLHENLTDSIAASDAAGAVKAILSWRAAAGANLRQNFSSEADQAAADELRSSSVVEDLSIAKAKEQTSRAADVDALVLALDARAALEIGITRSLGDALTTESEREALVARLRAFTPLIRGAGPARVSRYIRADDAFHRIFFSLLRNPALFEIYNAMDLPELMRRVLEEAPPSIREVFDDHAGLTDALRRDDPVATGAAITAHANRVRSELAGWLAETGRAA